MSNQESHFPPREIDFHVNGSLDQVPNALIETNDNGVGLDLNSVVERGEQSKTLRSSTESSSCAPMDSMIEPAKWNRCLERRSYVVRIAAQLKEKISSFAVKNATSDTKISLSGVHIMESTETLKLFKFLFATLATILAMHQLIRKIGWENDYRYSIEDFLYYDLNHVILDSFAFFFVGRLYKRPGIDRIVCIAPMIFSCFYASWITNFWFLQNSVTLYNVFCIWPWQLFVYASFFGAIIIYVAVMHISASIRDSSYIYRLVEFVLGLSLFVPFIFHGNFHVHHWYSFWLLGMHCNREEWWSSLVLYLSWGQYINGIAVYGRDPIISNQVCRSFLHRGLIPFGNETHLGDIFAKMKVQENAPNWRTCS